MAALEDKIVQKAACAVLNAIYEAYGFSYGFRPKRSQHDALDALITGIHCRPSSLPRHSCLALCDAALVETECESKVGERS